MVRTRASGSCRKAERARSPWSYHRCRAGFTLVELMVVLAIIAGLLVIAAPGFLKLYASVRLSFDRKDLERQLLNLPREARESGTNEVLVDPAIADPAHEPVNVAEFESWKPVRLDLPKGWTMTVPKPIVYHFTGACDGGTVTFSFPPLSLSYVLTPPLCRPLPADASNQ